MPAVAWGEWRPDVSSYDNKTTQYVQNVFPRGDGYGPVPSMTEFTGDLPAQCRGAFLGLNSDGTLSLFAGTATDLYIMSNSTLGWLNVTQSAGSAATISGGTNIGNMTGGGGLAAAFDGTTSQAIASCASLASVTTTAYVGKHLATSSVVRGVTVFGSSDQGYVSGANPTTVLNLYASQTAPSNSTNGTLLGTLSFTDTGNESTGRVITSNDPNTVWNYVWINPTTASSSTIDIAEIQLTTTSPYSLPAAAQWQFAQAGTTVIAVNADVAPQAFTLQSSSEFAALGGSPPQAAYITMVNNFVVLSGLVSAPYEIEWSGEGAVTSWTPGTNQAGTNSFNDGGPVLGLAGGEEGYVFQANCIRQITFVGGSDVFQFTRITEDRGLYNPYSLIRSADRVHFLSESGFFELQPGPSFVPIGKEKFDRTFFAAYDSTQPQLLFGAHDPGSTRVFWFFKSMTGQSTVLFDTAICYDWALERASLINMTGEAVATLGQPGVTLDSLPNIGYTDLDTIPVSLDDITGSISIAMSVFDSSHSACFLSGANLQAIIETPQSAPDGRRQFIRSARPLTDAPTVYGSVFYKQKLADTDIQSAESLMNAVGFTPHRVDGRPCRYRNRIPAGTNWTYSIGVEPESVPTGQQ